MLWMRSRPGMTLFAASCGVLLALAGCGGGSGNTAGNTSPTRATKDRVLQMQTQNVRLVAQNGGQTASLALAQNGSFINGAAATTGLGGGASSPGTSVGNRMPLPFVGAFIQNVASVPRSGRAVAIHRMTRTRDSVPPTDASSPTFYFDDYLGLWVEIIDNPTQSSYALFEDQGKTLPAGSIVTNFPASDASPQVYSSTYSFTAGLLKGSHGSYNDVQNADGSGSSTYDDVSADGWKDNGQSSWTANGDYTWKSHTDAPGSFSTNDRGTFHADGIGLTHSDSSDGYTSDYTYRSDGSGFARINGPAPGLPARIVWDTLGNTTITYADGSVDHFNSWGYGGVAVQGSGTGTASASPSTSPFLK